MKARINIEILAGTDIYDAFVEAVRIASLLNVFVSFSFNDVQCTAHPYGLASIGAAEYHELSKKDTDLKFAHARREKK